MISHIIRKRFLLIQWIVENLVCFLYIQNKRDLILQILISILSTKIEWKQCTLTINNDLYLSCDWVFFFGKKRFYKSTFIKDLVHAKNFKTDFPKFISFFCQLLRLISHHLLLKLPWLVGNSIRLLPWLEIILCDSAPVVFINLCKYNIYVVSFVP